MESTLLTTESESREFAEKPKSIPHKSLKQLAWDDIRNGFKQWNICWLLAYQDIKLRYRRSALGPFWITISMAITIYSMGFLYGHLFRMDLQTYFPFLSAGLLSWALISVAISELSDAFVHSEGLIKQIKLPYSIYIHRVVLRNYIIFFHNIVLMIPVIFIFHTSVNLNTLLLIPDLILIYINAFTFGIFLALIGGRYRDLGQVIKSLIQVIFFVTPIIWDPAILPQKYQFLAYLNPFYSFIELIRAPLMGTIPPLFVFYITAAVTCIGIILSWILFSRYRARIVYWL